MRKVETLSVEYAGYAKPETENEVLFEIAGLESAICEINGRIARLKQALALNKLFGDTNDKNKPTP